MYVKCEYFMNQKTPQDEIHDFCEGINGDGARKTNKLLNTFVD
jgi:hypothetical protein